MALADARAQDRPLGFHIVYLGAVALDDGGLAEFRDPAQIAAGFQSLLEANIDAIEPRDFAADRGQSAVQGLQLLLGDFEGLAGCLCQLDPRILHVILGAFDADAQLLDTIRQPGGGRAGGFELAVELVENVLVRYCIDELRGCPGIGGGIRDLDHIRGAERAQTETRADIFYDVEPGAAGCLFRVYGRPFFFAHAEGGQKIVDGGRDVDDLPNAVEHRWLRHAQCRVKCRAFLKIEDVDNPFDDRCGLQKMQLVLDLGRIDGLSCNDVVEFDHVCLLGVEQDLSGGFVFWHHLRDGQKSQQCAEDHRDQDDPFAPPQSEKQCAQIDEVIERLWRGLLGHLRLNGVADLRFSRRTGAIHEDLGPLSYSKFFCGTIQAYAALSYCDL